MLERKRCRGIGRYEEVGKEKRAGGGKKIYKAEKIRFGEGPKWQEIESQKNEGRASNEHRKLGGERGVYCQGAKEAKKLGGRGAGT